ncbi:MAG: FAD-dependent oxidoreductase [Verrucomicrobiaceae bacterium]|nr:MAG: FAD-dependent oxidoreductase [Verrucomicrobiaceae bacterium]
MSPASWLKTALVTAILCQTVSAAEVITADICIYGGNAGGVAAGVQAARMGKTAVIIEPGNHLGGMTSGGLGSTDIGNKAAIGGIAREFYHRVAQHYSRPEAWQAETKPSSTLARLAAPDATMWTFEPHVAENILNHMAEEAQVRIVFRQPLLSVKKDGERITEITTADKIFRAKMFIDATYEGDLMAKAGVSFTVGREANSQYNETLNGICAKTPEHQFTVAVDPYLKPGDPSSGLLPFIQSGDGGKAGAGDRAVQAYNFRLCYTKNPANRLPHTKPDGYDPAKYELLARYLEALVAARKQPELMQFLLVSDMPNQKTDINNRGGFSTDFIGANYDYPNANYATRAKIRKAHEDYIRGFFFFLATSPRVPENIHKEIQEWGPAKDEFSDTGGWPHQLYVREARRMVSDYVMTEHNCRGALQAADPVGLAAYTMDSHNCQRIVKNGRVENEGDVEVGGFPPYPIAYRSIVPKSAECENLFVPVCLSATHIAYGSIRMEPVFMLLGQSAATAAALALDANVSAQKLDYEKLRDRLLADKQVLAWKPASPPVHVQQSSTIIVDDSQTQITGEWVHSDKVGPFVGSGYLHDDDSDKGQKQVRFVPTLPSAGQYKVSISYAAERNRADNVPVVIHYAAGEETVIVNQQQPQQGGQPLLLGTFNFEAGNNGWVEIRTMDTAGHVIADAIYFEPVPTSGPSARLQ